MTDAPGDAGQGDASGPRNPKRRGGSLTGRALILALVAVTLFVALIVPVRTWLAQRAEIAQLRADVEAVRDRVADLQIQKERWEDPAFVAAEARRRLHFVLPGEIGYVTLGTQTAEELAAEQAASDAAPWYAALWGATQEVDSPAKETAKKAEAP